MFYIAPCTPISLVDFNNIPAGLIITSGELRSKGNKVSTDPTDVLDGSKKKLILKYGLPFLWSNVSDIL